MNHHDEQNLPEMRIGMLSQDDVCALLRDLKDCATAVQATVKCRGRQTADEAARSIEEAGAMLLAGDAHGIQVRYCHNGREYCDTILRAAEGFRLVRL